MAILSLHHNLMTRRRNVNYLFYIFPLIFFREQIVGWQDFVQLRYTDLSTYACLFAGGKEEISHTSSRLVIPVFDILCPYLPATWRRKLRCGVPVYGDDEYDDGEKHMSKKEMYIVQNGNEKEMTEMVTSLMKETHDK